MSERLDEYGRYLESAGLNVICVDGVNWYEYSGFMMPAYLPHCMPEITEAMAKKALSESGRPFVRWTSRYEGTASSEWWHVIRCGPYEMSECSANTRSKINRGMKKLQARHLTNDEVLAQGYKVCERAVSRFDSVSFLPKQTAFRKQVIAAAKFPGTKEFCGVFHEDCLVGFSENILQDNAVFWETIWYDPKYMGMYSSYVLTNYMLDYYLNKEKLRYVSDGSRSIYHETNVQDFFTDKFGFIRSHSLLHVKYNFPINVVVITSYSLRNMLLRLEKWCPSVEAIKKLNGLVAQERIRRSSVLRNS